MGEGRSERWACPLLLRDPIPLRVQKSHTSSKFFSTLSFFSFLTHSSPLITCFPASCGNVGPSWANLALPSRRFDQKEDIILWNRSQVFRGTQPLHVEHLTTFPDARARVGPYVRPARGKREALCESWWEAVEVAVEDWARAKDKGSGHGV